ncbi:hypothetical protein GCM10010517_05620 [Streptosporangium fragile]|uniref:Methyltransferase domain-containing protein n=1 Tax=Streptosporangium fragile TaxID=46186 RepID=A0ABN3VQ84_9ACTN
MEPSEIERRAAELGPWVSSFEFGGAVYPRANGTVVTHEIEPRTALHRQRVAEFFEAFPGAARILELGILEGADTVHLAARPGTEVVGIEGRAENLARARFVMELHGLTEVRLLLGDVETMDLGELGEFDAVMCAGLLYHLTRPWETLADLRKVTGRLYLQTHYWNRRAETHTVGGYTVKTVSETYSEPRLRGLAERVLWFDRASLLTALRDAGFDRIQVIRDEADGPVGTIVLTCSASGVC